MPADIYEIIALGARWWFLLLGALIVLRAFGWLRRDARRKKRRLRQLPDAGMVGEMVVVIGNDELEDGWVIPVPREGTLGCFRSCDVVVPAEGVAPQHCDFSFVNGKGLIIYPRRKCYVTVDGEEFTGLRKGKKYPMTHGSRLQIGDAVLRLRLFEGLETQGGMHLRDEWHLDVQEEYEQTQDAWQQTTSIYHQEPKAWEDAQQFQQQSVPAWQQPQPVQPWQQPMPYQPPVNQVPYQQNPYQQNPYQQQGWQQPMVPGQQPVCSQQPVMQAYPPQEAQLNAAETETDDRPHAQVRHRRRRRSDEES